MIPLGVAVTNPIAYYLSACYAYDIFNTPIMEDRVFDALGIIIHRRWDELKHPHKYLVDRDSCHYTSGITQPYEEWPSRIVNATKNLINKE